MEYCNTISEFSIIIKRTGISEDVSIWSTIIDDIEFKETKEFLLRDKIREYLLNKTAKKTYTPIENLKIEAVYELHIKISEKYKLDKDISEF